MDKPQDVVYRPAPDQIRQVLERVDRTPRGSDEEYWACVLGEWQDVLEAQGWGRRKHKEFEEV